MMLLAALLGCVAGADDPARLTTDGDFKQHLQWSPDGQHLTFTRIHDGAMAIWTMTADGRNARRLLPNHRMPHFDAHWSPDGKTIVYVYDQLQGTDGKLQINTCTPDGADDKVLIPHKAFEQSPRWSPDGTRLLWCSTRDKNHELYTVTPEGKDQKRLTTEAAADLYPAWSPDGKRIAFTSGRGGFQKLYVMDADGKNIKKLTTGDHLDRWPVWHPDGKQIVYVSNVGGQYDLWRIDADGTNARRLTDHPAKDDFPAIHPDGNRIAFTSTRHGGCDVYVIPW